MRLLIDSHVIIWAVDDPSQLTPTASAALQDPANELLASAATVWEIASKAGLGKLVLALPYRAWMTQTIADLGLVLLPITVEYADVQSGLPRHHGDPVDRLLVAQALLEQISIVSADPAFDPYGVTRLW